MSVHPEFLDSVSKYVNLCLAKWDAAHPQPKRDVSMKPQQPEELECPHSRGNILLSVKSTETVVTILRGEESFSIQLASGQLHLLIEQLLTIQSDVIEFEEWANNAEVCARWQSKRDRFAFSSRMEFIRQYEHRVLLAEEDGE